MAYYRVKFAFPSLENLYSIKSIFLYDTCNQVYCHIDPFLLLNLTEVQTLGLATADIVHGNT